MRKPRMPNVQIVQEWCGRLNTAGMVMADPLSSIAKNTTAQ